MPQVVSEAELESGIDACRSNNPCEAAWQEAYAYSAGEAYELAVFQALQGIVFAGLQYASADRTADLQYDIADRQMRIAEEEYQRYKDNYVECEDALAAEICATECEAPDYDVRADRALRDVRKQFSMARKKLERSRMRYCMADQLRAHCELEKAEALAVVQARDLAYRYAEKRADFLDERRWNRRVVILQHGRSIQTGQMQAYSNASVQASAALQSGQDATRNLLGTISGGIGSILNANYANNLAGYYNTNNQTQASTFINSSVPTPVQSNGFISGIRG